MSLSSGIHSETNDQMETQPRNGDHRSSALSSFDCHLGLNGFVYFLTLDFACSLFPRSLICLEVNVLCFLGIKTCFLDLTL